MNDLINVGDRINTCDQQWVTLNKIENGRLGLIVTGLFDNGLSFQGYLPWELPPQELELGWYGWSGRGYIELPDGEKLGVLGFPRGTGLHVVEKYDKEWLLILEHRRSLELAKGQSLGLSSLPRSTK